MKKLLSIVALFCVTSVVCAQSFAVSADDQQLNPNDTIVVVAENDMPQARPFFTNNSENTVVAQVRVDPVEAGGMEVMAICAGECVPGNLSPEVTINAGETYTGCYVDFMTNGGTEGLFEMKIYNTADENDFVITYIKVVVNDVSVDNVCEETMFDAFPNPASQHVNIQYNLNESNGKVVIYDVLGHCVKVVNVNNGSNNVVVNTSDLPGGVYMYGIVEGRRASNMKKLVIQ